jgi:hypothetical protein
MNLQSGNLVKVLHETLGEGIGYIYDNGATVEAEKVLILGVSWKNGGVANKHLEDFTSSPLVKIVPVELKKTFEEEILDLLGTEIKRLEDEVLDYFEDHDVDTEHQCLDLRAMARETGISIHNLHVWLLNMEDADVMQDIANGDYESFDVDDRNQFSDSYLDLMSDYSSRSFPFK